MGTDKNTGEVIMLEGAPQQLQQNFKNNFLNSILMKYFIVLFLLACSYFGYGQANDTKEFRVYNTFQDYTNNNYTVINDSLSSVSDNKSILDSTLKKVWGISYEESLYRIFNDRILKIEDSSGLIIYTITFMKDHLQAYPIWVPLNIEGSGFPGWFPINFYESQNSKRKDYYFSITLESEILELSKKEVRKQINNKDFDKALKKEFNWLTPISEFDDKDNIFLINKVYNTVFKN